MDQNNILISRFSAIGDVAMTIPVVYSLCRAYPDKKFIFLTRSFLAELFINPPSNLTVHGVDLRDRRYASVNGMRRLARELVATYRCGLYFDLHDVIRTRLLAFFLRLHGVKVTVIDKGRKEKKSLTRRHNKHLRPLPSQISRYAATFAKKGLPLTDADLAGFKGLFGERNSAPLSLFSKITPPKKPGERWLAVAPFAAHEGKIYPPELMRRVVAMLASRPYTQIFLLGGGGHEQMVLESWAGSFTNVTSLAGKKYGFAAELALLNHCDATVTMDSANMHLAALALTPIVAVWGATHPYTGFAPWGASESRYIEIQLPMPCRPCSVFGNAPCRRGDYFCLSGIKPSQIADAVSELLPSQKNG